MKNQKFEEERKTGLRVYVVATFKVLKSSSKGLKSLFLSNASNGLCTYNWSGEIQQSPAFLRCLRGSIQKIDMGEEVETIRIRLMTCHGSKSNEQVGKVFPFSSDLPVNDNIRSLILAKSEMLKKFLGCCKYGVVHGNDPEFHEKIKYDLEVVKVEFELHEHVNGFTKYPTSKKIQKKESSGAELGVKSTSGFTNLSRDSFKFNYPRHVDYGVFVQYPKEDEKISFVLEKQKKKNEKESKPKEYEKWTKEQVGDWINSLNTTKKYGKCFLKNGITGAVLKIITREDLEKIGVDIYGDLLLILKEIQSF